MQPFRFGIPFPLDPNVLPVDDSKREFPLVAPQFNRSFALNDGDMCGRKSEIVCDVFFQEHLRFLFRFPHECGVCGHPLKPPLKAGLLGHFRPIVVSATIADQST